MAGKGVKAGMGMNENVCFGNKNGSKEQILDGKGGGVVENIQQTNVRQSVLVNCDKKEGEGKKVKVKNKK